MAIFLRLSKSGYGSLNEIRDWDSETVLSALQYDIFIRDLEEAFFEMNKDRK